MSEEFSGGADAMLTGFVPGSRIAGYRLEERIGAGGMAVVFRAIDERLGRPVALKAMSPGLAADDSFRQRFIRESRAAAAVDDPHIIPVYEAGEAQGILFIAMRFVPGGDVRALMRREGLLPFSRSTAIISAIASALDAAHAAGLIHRDVKPANMLVDVRPDRPDHVYLSDFGLSKGTLSTGVTASGVFLGTLDYSSPEQIAATAIDARTDQYSLACAAFELLSGSPPFIGDQIPAIIWAHMSEPPPKLSSRRSGIAPAVDEVFIKALAKVPGDRYASCKEFADALRQALGIGPYHVATGPGPGAGGPIRGEHVSDHSVTDVAAPAGPVVVRAAPGSGSRAEAAPEAEPSAAQHVSAARDLAPERVTQAAPGVFAPEVARPTEPPIRPTGGGTMPARPRRPRPWMVVTAAGLSMALLATVAAAFWFSHDNGGHRLGSGTAAQPAYGGTLKIVANGGPTGLDPMSSYYSPDYVLERAYARQLVTYPTIPDPSVSSRGWAADTTPVADVATTVPTTANGGITDGGRTYTFHIKPGVMWNTSPPRTVAAGDFVREFKAFCNPVSPVGNVGYYDSTIQGLSQYCSAESAYFRTNSATAVNIAAFQDSHAIAGISAVNASTLRFHLTGPARDFLYMLALPFASARPVEYDVYLPGSAGLAQNLLSDGPYEIASYSPGMSLMLTRNPAWRQTTDLNRHQFVSQIAVTINGSSAGAAFSSERSGAYDMSLDTSVPAADFGTLEAARDPKFSFWPAGSMFYVVFNLRSPDSGGAMGKLAVRRAIEYGIDKVAVQRVKGGSQVAPILNVPITPGNAGYQNVNLYPTPGNEGDAAKCRSLLSKAGYNSGLSAVYLYNSSDSASVAIFHAIKTSLAPCGITLNGKALSFSKFFIALQNTSASAKAGSWDLATSGWAPDWFGDNGRSITAELFQSNCEINTINFGCYSNPRMDSLISQAESAPTITAAYRLWRQADLLAIRDAVIVPLISQQQPSYSSARVHQYCPKHVICPTAIVSAPNIGGPDITSVWLSGG